MNHVLYSRSEIPLSEIVNTASFSQCDGLLTKVAILEFPERCLTFIL
jgi:hypothetical protein